MEGREGKGRRATNKTLEVDEAQALADVVAYEDQVWLQEPPAVGAGCVVELETILSSPEGDFENEGLINVS